MANNGTWLKAILASACFFSLGLAASVPFVHTRQVPLLGARPAITQANIQENGEQLRASARLWQDPFAVVEKSLVTSAKNASERLQTPSVGNARNSPVTEEEHETLVIGVMVPGASFPDDAERRRRTRFAVLAGLSHAGFAPKDSSHLNYFLWPHVAQAQVGMPQLTQNHEEPYRDEARERVQQKRPPVLRPDPRQNQGLEQEGDAKKNRLARSVAERHESVVPFEWFDEVSQRFRDAEKRIIVVWLNEDDFRGEPLRKLSGLRRYLFGDAHEDRASRNFKLIGPYSSDVLRDMVNEARKFIYAPPYHKAFGRIWGIDNWPALKDVQFYAYGAAAADNQLLGNLTGTYGTVQRYFDNLGLHLQRTIATNGALARGLVSELNRRKVRLGPAGGDVALISDWDTYYGQSLPEAVELALGHPRPGWRGQRSVEQGPDWIHKFTYLRGLDGQFPETSGAKERDEINAPPHREQRAGADTFFKIQSDTNTAGWPIGQSQFDYLRRISEQLQKIDQDLRLENRRIRAIGVLGSDVFDKLLVLRALRQKFPDAQFFTADFDQAFTMESELPWTRNLLISSSFGPSLHKNIQGKIPSFRDACQTSAFLATLLAIGDPQKNWATPQPVPDYISDHLLISRIFEVERNGDLLSLPGDRVPTRVASPLVTGWQREKCQENSLDCGASQMIASANTVAEGRSSAQSGAAEFAAWDCKKGENSTNCGDIQPPTGKLFPRFEKHSQHALSVGFATGAFVVLLALYMRLLPTVVTVEAWLIALCLAAGGLACAFWEPLGQFLTEHGNGEPIALLQGVSIWPMVLLRGLGIILAMYLIWRAQRKLRNNLAIIADALNLEVALPASPSGQPLRDKLAVVFNPVRGNGYTAQPTAIEGKTIWDSYFDHEKFLSRFWRTFSYTAVMYLFATMFVFPIFGNPAGFARGGLASGAYHWTTFLFVLIVLFMTFFVFDAAWCCLRFINKLRREMPQWPKETTGLFNAHLRLQGAAGHDWNGLEFVARRTFCIGSLIYYPFALTAVLIATCSTAFANSPPKLSGFVAVGLALFTAIACVIMLCSQANKVRAAAKQNLVHAIISAKANLTNGSEPENGASGKGTGDSGRYVDQLEVLLRQVNQLTDGAFGPFSLQPLVRAMLLPIAGFGWTVLVENGMFPGL